MSSGKITFRVPLRDIEDPAAPRRAPHAVLDSFGGGSPYGSTTYKRKRLCPFEDALVSVVRLRPERNNEALDVGWIYHAALEAYYRALRAHQEALGAPPARSDKAAWQHYFFGASSAAENAALDVVDAFKAEPGYRQTHYDVERVVAGYFERYRSEDQHRILAVEETLIYEELNPPPIRLSEENNEGGGVVSLTPFCYSARLDVVIQDCAPGRDGVYVKEHKSAKFINEDLIHGYQQDMQILGQYWLMQRCVDLAALPAPLKGVIINLATKEKTPRYERVEVCPSPYHLRAFEDSARRWSVMNTLFEWAGHPKALGSCAGALRGYSRCAYYDLCHAYPERTIADFVREAPPVGFMKE